MFQAGLSQDTIDEYVASERRRAITSWSRFSIRTRWRSTSGRWIIEEGAPFGVISSAVQRLQPDVLVIGTHGRSGIAKTLLRELDLEEVLRSLDVDILAVPPAR